MKIIIDDATFSAKTLYYQSLVLLFLPCEKFGEGDDKDTLYIKAFRDNGNNHVFVKLVVDGCEYSKEDVQVIDESVYAQMKNFIGRTFLKVAVDAFGVLPPWGISTGVKPVKLARFFVKALGADEAFNVLCNEYMISPEKAKMAISACMFEDKLMDNMGENPFSLYISVPFCPSKCNYCSFVSCTTPKLLSLIPDYVDKLKRDISLISETSKELNLNLKSVYIGGGTPAILNERQIDSLIQCIYSNFADAKLCEFTFEAGRPDCITFDKLKVLKDYNIPRISINTQTTNDAVLSSIGRNHNYADYIRAMEYAKQLSFKCVNTDLIAGLPGEDYASFCKSVIDVANLYPENITIHAFTLKKSSNYRVSGKKDYFINDIDALKMTDFASGFLAEKGYNPYYVYRQKNTTANLENVGYSITGHESIYNVIMMSEYHTVFGAGAGSVTKIVTQDGNKVDRIFSPKYPYEYLDDEKYSGFSKDAVLRIYNER